MTIELNGFVLELSLLAIRHGAWISPVHSCKTDRGFQRRASGAGGRVETRSIDRFDSTYALRFTSPHLSRLRLRLELPGETDLFHLIPRQYSRRQQRRPRSPRRICLPDQGAVDERNCSPLWEFARNRASHPVSILGCSSGAVGVSIDPYSDSRKKPTIVSSATACSQPCPMHLALCLVTETTR